MILSLAAVLAVGTFTGCGARNRKDIGKGVGNEPSESNQGSGAQNQNREQGRANVSLSEEEAKAIVLERVPGATDRDVRMELDCDDGVCCYEGDIVYEQVEYEFEVDANSGTILSWQEEQR